jgi:hypothetical protein
MRHGVKNLLPIIAAVAPQEELVAVGHRVDPYWDFLLDALPVKRGDRQHGRASISLHRPRA